MSDPIAASQVDTEITEGVRALVKEEKLPIVIRSVSLGRAKPNENVLAQMNETAAQQQRQKTLVAATLAEKDREQEQIAKAKADNAYRNAMGLSPDMFIQLEAIKRFSDACKTSTCVIGQPGVGLNVSHK
jgi:regulator of protease activity HflC (stomatin/prohibitin superfamily)